MAPKEQTETNMATKPEPVDIDVKQKPMVKYWFGEFQHELIWTNILMIGVIHVFGIYAILTYPYISELPRFVVLWFTGCIAGIGVTMGAHRLWTHRTYKANLPLRILLILMYASAGEYSLYQWVRDHRLHHKHSDTEADPHNSQRGLFYSHIGWFFMKRTPISIIKGKQIDSSDVLADPVVKVYMKVWMPLHLIMSFIAPAMLMYHMFDVPFNTGLLFAAGRFVWVNNLIWLVNSLAHYSGAKTYNKNINPREVKTLYAFTLFGEGFHNYHHTFPWDYKTSELGEYLFNAPAFFIDAFAKIGWAYDLKSPSDDLIRRVVLSKGDGSHFVWGKEVPFSADTKSEEFLEY